jgi:hypothetical protein
MSSALDTTQAPCPLTWLGRLVPAGGGVVWGAAVAGMLIRPGLGSETRGRWERVLPLRRDG